MFFPIDESENIELPQCLVTCGSLEVLKLCLPGCHLRLPSITGFQALRVLELKEVNLIDDDIVKHFVESCPVLEDLSLIDCPVYSLVISSPKLKVFRTNGQLDSGMCFKVEICCPKLEFLKLTGYVALKIFIASLCSLERAILHPKDLFLWEAPTFDFFARISHVESLSISLYCVGQCFHPEVDAPISLPNLKTLELTVDGYNMDALIPFLTCLPDLESLHLIIPREIYCVGMWNLDKAATMSIWTRNLKRVDFLEFDEEKEKLKVARALLQHGKALDEMVFRWGDEDRFHERSMETMNRVSNFQNASSTVKLRSVIDPRQHSY